MYRQQVTDTEWWEEFYLHLLSTIKHQVNKGKTDEMSTLYIVIENMARNCCRYTTVPLYYR